MKPALFDCIRKYSLKSFLSDLMSGILVAIIALPLSIALGIQSSATLQQGIITAIVAGFIISAMGGSRFQIGGPTAAFVSIIVGYVADPNIGMLGVQVATMMAGLILMFMGIFRVGGIIKYMPYPIVAGFTSGIGITLMFGQFKDFFGLNFVSSGANFFDKVVDIGSSLGTISWVTLALGAVTIAIMALLPRLNKRIPSAFIAILFTTIVTVIMGIYSPTRFGVDTISSTFGEVKAVFYLPSFGAIPSLNFAKLIVPAIVIAFLASIESLLSARVADGLTGTSTDSNAELLAQGVANIAGSLVGGLPATGAIARTTANIRAGATSPISGMIHSLTLLIMFFTLMPLVGYIPMTSLAAVLIMTAMHMTNFKLFGKLLVFNVRDFLILATTFLFTVGFDLVYGVLLGLVMTILTMAPMLFSKTKMVTMDVPNTFILDSVNTTLDCSSMLCISGDLTFLNANKFIKTCQLAVGNSEYLVINMQHVTSCDLTTLEQLSKYNIKLAKSNQKILLLYASASIQAQYNKCLGL